MKKILFLLLISSAAFGQAYNGTIIRGVQYTVNAANSSTANLAPGAFFTGTITSANNSEPNIQISVTTDQPMEVYLDQFNDIGGTQVLPVSHWDITTTGLNQNLQLVGNFFRVRVKNVGIATTSSFSVQITTGLMDVGARNYIYPPLGTDEGMGVRPIPQINWRTTFAKVLGSTWDTENFARVSLGAGMATSQSGGNGVITSGTTVNSETILRSRRNFTGSFLLRAQTTLSQRIVNNNFIVELVDVIGDGLVLTAVSATSAIVTIPNNPYTSENVGQFINIGAIAVGSIPGTVIPGRYAIASVSGNNVTFTVAGWTGATSGTGTCSLFGWNYHQLIYSGTTATNVTYDAQRRGWASGGTTATINTTAAPGHMAIMGSDDGNAFLADQLVASATAIPVVTRASRAVSIADETADLWLQIRVLNGTTAPASTTTWTIGTVSVENFASQQVTLASSKVMGANAAASVKVENTVTVSATNLQTNVAQINGVAPLMGNGVTGTGSHRVTISSDNTSNTNPWLVSLNRPEQVIDVASAAITTTTTTGTFTPTRGASYYVEIPITAVSGTTPTYDGSIEESDGTNWFKVWDFERATATGVLRSPMLPDRGNSVRYVQTLTGTTPSFTRAINRYQVNQPATPKARLIDRTISLTTLNSTSPVIQTGGATIVQLIINVGAITTTAPAISIEGSEDNFVTFYTLPVSALTAVASSTVQTTLVGVSAPFIRAKVTTAGVGVTAGYISLKAF